MADEPSEIKRIPPHSTEAERAVLGAMIMDPDAIASASEILTGADFYQRHYGIIFDAIRELFNENSAVDIVTLRERLGMKNLPAEYSSVDFLTSLADSVPTSANVTYYAKLVKENSTLRSLIRVSEGIAGSCYAHDDTLQNIMGKAEENIFKVLQQNTDSTYRPIDQIVMEVFSSIEAAARSTDSVTGVRTGFYQLDYMTSGLQNSDLILIAARPSMGKTAFALNIAQYVCIRSKLPTVIFSLEMSQDQLVQRLLSMESHVDSQSMRNGSLKPSDWDKLVDAAGAISSAPLYIDDKAGISITELRSKCRKYKLEHGIGLVIIDYLQLMSGSGSSAASRQQEISEISRSLKAMARELDVPVIALSQLSRACEQRPDHHPLLSDLRESGAIEQDADVVMFLYRDEYYNKDTEKKGITEIIIAKQRNGPVGSFELVWLNDYTKFANKEIPKQ